MGIPEGSFAVAALIVFAFPGLVYSAVRRWARGEGPEDRDVGLSIARGAILSVVLTSLYLVVFGGALFDGVAPGPKDDSIRISDPRVVGAVVLLLYVAVPLVVAFALHRTDFAWTRIGKDGRVRRSLPRSRHGYTDTPTPWDHALRRNAQSFVKVRRADGTWIGGWYTNGSFASSYPEPRSIYIDRQFSMSSDGNFIAEIEDTGVLVTVVDADIVMWTKKKQ